MRTLLIDNYDSYSYNLFQLIAEVNGEEPVVVRNDGVTWPEVESAGYANIVISPGPGHPGRPRDFGVCADVLAHATVPILGVCLGHQGLVSAAGGVVTLAPMPMHGRLSQVSHDDTGIFAGLPQGFRAVRYHSLAAVEPLPPGFVKTAWSDDGVIMGVRALDRPRWGVQFHPESISTEYGRTMLTNFRDLSAGRPTVTVADRSRREGRQKPDRPSLGVVTRRLERWVEPEAAFRALFGDTATAFWLDSSRVEPGLSRFSFMGTTDGPLAHVLTYDVGERAVREQRPGERRERVVPGDLFSYLETRLEDRAESRHDLPFEFQGGYVGYIGYEVKADCGGQEVYSSAHPDAALVFADRLLAFDHDTGTVHLVALVRAAVDTDTELAEHWFDVVSTALAEAQPVPPVEMKSCDVDVRPDADRESYTGAIRACLEYLRQGESYEICLTDRIRLPRLDVPCLDVYRVLRAINPAPYAAYLRFGELEVLCSSPERFLRIDSDGWVETKPIKGTARRDADPVRDAQIADHLRHDEKSRAENLMIVDLLRNDLGKVSEIGSVQVPKLMAVESYETVHQLVSTVRARLRPDVGAIGCLRAAFPGGSMTGAPKLRTMELIDRLESQARGVYSGTIGFLSVTGAADLNIVIRTIVADETGTTIGAGGAIVAQSDPDDEYDEIVLKATAPVRAIALARAAVEDRLGEPAAVLSAGGAR